ncbi:acyl carrier protein [Nostoc flagelliforme FACHB-838]|uniref:Acyl carrier protein n=1 Tax=Nostoc flagelliforme FACHB-838 TaxID=2692904 RepID=A0ABR8DYM6_9NOSO|nr:acyl carrier protein [Nostoc flagelliforme]MBD2534577.1 acyl carrier protein [Nostoc flagelliforme FACHB-838]
MEIQNPKVAQMSMESESNKTDVKENAYKKPVTAAEIQAWLVSYLAEVLEIDPNNVEVRISFERYGLDSSAAVVLIGDMEDWLGYELDPTLLVDYPTIEALSGHLAKEYKVKI